VSSPLYCFQVQVGPVITEGECTVGGCSDWRMSGCSHVTLQMDLREVNEFSGIGNQSFRHWLKYWG